MDIKKYFDTLNVNIICAGFLNNKDDVFCKDEICEFNKIYYLKSGSVNICYDSDSKKVTNDSLIIIPANKKHTITTKKNEKIEAYWIYFDAFVLSKNFFDLVLCPHFVSVDNDELITRLFESILYDVENLPEISKALNDKCFVIRMISYFIEKGGYILKDSPLKNTVDFIEENIDKKIGVADIASVMNVKNNQCTNSFNETFGVSPLKFVNDIRILNARYLLENTDKKIGQIAKETGCGSVYAFSKMFKSNVGFSPSKYRHIFGKTFKVE